MEQIIFIGDSLTWCENPNTCKRYEESLRWTTIVDKEIRDHKVSCISLPGMALAPTQDTDYEDWFGTSHLFIEKSLKSYEEDFEDVFMFFGANNIKPDSQTTDDIKNYYQKLIDSIRERIFGIKNVYIMLLPNMNGLYSEGFSIKELNNKFRKLDNVQGFVDLSNMNINSKDNIHFSVNDNKEVAERVIRFIKEKGDYK